MLGNKSSRPANRFTGFNTIEYTRDGDHRTTTDAATAYRWYNCGQRVTIVCISHMYKMNRNSAYMTETASGKVIARVKRKDGILWDAKLSNRIAHLQGHEINFNLF